jgi:hypothetical protein
MPALISSLMFAVLVATIPFTLVLVVLLRLPAPLASSHRRWPLPLNFVLIATITVCVTYFIRSVYYVHGAPAQTTSMKFLIVMLGYGFALVLLMRQFCGVYPEFIVTTGALGIGLRKTTYGNILSVEKLPERGGETQFQIGTAHGVPVTLILPSRYVSVFDKQIRLRQEERDRHARM